MKTLLPIVSTVVLFSGCASIMNDSTHPMKIDAKTADGRLVSGADCKVTNDYGDNRFKSGDTIQARRSSKDLDIVCTDASAGTASGRAISRVNGGMFGNIILGGGIGALIDHNKGTAYTYPTWVQLVFGKLLSFDRNAEKEGQPLQGVDIK
jgi:hypothetical protein